VVRGREVIDDVGGGDMVCKKEHVGQVERKEGRRKQKVFGSLQGTREACVEQGCPWGRFTAVGCREEMGVMGWSCCAWIVGEGRTLEGLEQKGLARMEGVGCG
jgi:hypothetical protein